MRSLTESMLDKNIAIIIRSIVNTDNFINISPGELVYHKLINNDGVNFGVNFDK